MLLQVGAKGPEVLAWQVFLNQLGYAVPPLTADGDFGQKTKLATIEFQKRFKLDADGIVGPTTRAVAAGLGFADTKPALSKYPFVQSLYFTPANRQTVDLVVIHTMENQETPGQAMNVANWFANKYAPKFPSPRASCHYCVDNKEIVQCVLERDVAWHADAANRNGIGIEHSGRAAQSVTDWADDYSTAQLQLSAKLTAEICKRYNIPVVWLKAAELKAGKRGITGHGDVTQAYRIGNHTDPGPNFPIVGYLDLVKAQMG
jgi:N-acetyl-anhydromuramyl-L-alanine amidase AmpD